MIVIELQFHKGIFNFKVKGTLEGIVPLKSVHLCLQEGPLSFKEYTSKKIQCTLTFAIGKCSLIQALCVAAVIT